MKVLGARGGACPICGVLCGWWFPGVAVLVVDEDGKHKGATPNGLSKSESGESSRLSRIGLTAYKDERVWPFHWMH